MLLLSFQGFWSIELRMRQLKLEEISLNGNLGLTEFATEH
jgi:hypothetical protein